ncbi:MAG TPA: phage head closure protein [Candidatus Cybelea sp.]|nr:phage head closure protein [Candidatus Cybelea sp.]
MSAGLENLNPGELRRRITIQTLVKNQDALGGFTEKWEDVLYAWASIEPRTGRELTDAAQLYPETDTQIRVRWRTGLAEAMRILDEYGNQYDIYSIADIEERHRVIDIMARKRPTGRNV